MHGSKIHETLHQSKIWDWCAFQRQFSRWKRILLTICSAAAAPGDDPVVPRLVSLLVLITRSREFGSSAWVFFMWVRPGSIRKDAAQRHKTCSLNRAGGRILSGVGWHIGIMISGLLDKRDFSLAVYVSILVTLLDGNLLFCIVKSPAQKSRGGLCDIVINPDSPELVQVTIGKDKVEIRSGQSVFWVSNQGSKMAPNSLV